jgi:CheY-like chemotaxis protein
MTDPDVPREQTPAPDHGGFCGPHSAGAPTSASWRRRRAAIEVILREAAPDVVLLDLELEHGESLDVARDLAHDRRDPSSD